ncbi:hypothetical protein AMATHDRAFT_76666 [Amanita thiersii Skay4041]|uniref:Major facilitator superfamily (MFS) profile domain-containing protein n=1 Tax=Amanita thiersii Skay4041 TaxID=703135 RepID=A0A2A9NER4_9AGAR|nr:hypothetical protein AMATHDRAFT_76666 [Amanita thiersii Skay4041]
MCLWIVPVSSTFSTESTITLTDQTNLLPFEKVIVVFCGLSLCTLVSALDSVVIATTIPTISKTLNAGSTVSWVPAAFLLTSTSFQPLYGRFSDIFGRKAALTTAIAIFMIGNLISGFSKSINQLIIARGISGAGGGGILNMCQIIISDIVSLRERGKYQGIISFVSAIGFVVGPIIGGALSERVSWNWGFWITIPISLVSVCIVVFVLPLKPVQGSIRRKLFAIDYLGTILSLIGCGLILLPLIWGGVIFPWSSPQVLGSFCGGLVVTVVFCLWEWKGAELPIVPMNMFRQLTVNGVSIASFISGFISFSSIYYIPQYSQVVVGYNSLDAAVFLIPYFVTLVVGSWIVGMIIHRTGKYKTINASGYTLWAIACGLLSTVTLKTSMAAFVIYMLLAGLGAGQTIQTGIVAIQASVPRKDMSVVTAFRSFIRLLGGALTLAIGAMIINNTLRNSMVNLNLPSSIISTVIDNPFLLLASPASVMLSKEQALSILSNGYTCGFRIVFIVNAIGAAIAAIASIYMIEDKDLSRGEEVDDSLNSEKEPASGDSTNDALQNSKSNMV